VPGRRDKDVDGGWGGGLLSKRRRFTSTRVFSHVPLLLLLLLMLQLVAVAVEAVRALPVRTLWLLLLLLLLLLVGGCCCCCSCCCCWLGCELTVSVWRETFSLRGRLAMGEWMGEEAGEGGGAIIIIVSSAAAARAAGVAAAGSGGGKKLGHALLKEKTVWSM